MGPPKRRKEHFAIMVQQDNKQKIPTIDKTTAKRKRRGTCLAFMIIVREKKGIRSYYENTW